MTCFMSDSSTVFSLFLSFPFFFHFCSTKLSWKQFVACCPIGKREAVMFHRLVAIRSSPTTRSVRIVQIIQAYYFCVCTWMLQTFEQLFRQTNHLLFNRADDKKKLIVDLFLSDLQKNVETFVISQWVINLGSGYVFISNSFSFFYGTTSNIYAVG